MIDLGKISSPKQPEATSNEPKSNALSFLNKDIKLFKSKFNDKKKERFFSELSILLSSGVDLKTSLEIIVEQQKNVDDKALFSTIYSKVIEGENLSGALKHSGKFSEYDYYSVLIGEETGKINDVLISLASYYAGRSKQRRLVTSALAYPVLVLVTALGAVFFMMRFMVPMFVNVFARFKGELPALTRMVAGLSDAIAGGFWYFVFFIIILVLFVKWNKRKKWYRASSSKLLLSTPLIKGIVKIVYVQRFFQSMALLMGARLPMLRAIKLVHNMIGFYPFEQALIDIEKDIINGVPLNQSMRKFNLFDNRIVSLVKVAEEVNSLDVVFNKLSDQYAEELEHKLKTMGTLLEPILIVFVGLLVGIILIAMYLPMFKLSSSVF